VEEEQEECVVDDLLHESSLALAGYDDLLKSSLALAGYDDLFKSSLACIYC
jgi:hypothetical protein